MTTEIYKFRDVEPHFAFSDVQEAYNQSIVCPEEFHWHVHVPIVGGAEHSESLRQALLKIDHKDLYVSIFFNPQGPHTRYQYFSAYAPGVLIPVLDCLLRSYHLNVSAMMHPVTGFQFAEHRSPMARFYGAAMPADAISYEFLANCDIQNEIVPTLPRP